MRAAEIEGETWAPVPGWEGVYSASDLGRVRLEVDRQNISAGSILSPYCVRDGYLYVRLSLNDGSKAIGRHIARLVLSAFRGVPSGMQANHKSGDITDNRLANLEWVTHQENLRHSREVLGSTRKGIGNPSAKLTEVEVLDLRRRATTSETYGSIARCYGLTTPMVSMIAAGLAWAHVGGPRTTRGRGWKPPRG